MGWPRFCISDRARLAASWLELQSHLLTVDGCVAFSNITGGGDIYKWGTGEWILNRNGLGVLFCNAPCTPKGGYHTKAVVSWIDNREEGGLGDRRTLTSSS